MSVYVHISKIILISLRFSWYSFRIQFSASVKSWTESLINIHKKKKTTFDQLGYRIHRLHFSSGVRTPPPKYGLDVTINCILLWGFNPWAFRDVKNPCITITPRSTLTRIISTYPGVIYQLLRIIIICSCSSRSSYLKAFCCGQFIYIT